MRLLLFFFVFFIAVGGQAKELPLDYFVKQGDYFDMHLSPSGKYIAARMRHDNRIIAVFIERETGDIIGGLRPGVGDEIHSLVWVDDERVAYQLAERPHYLDDAVPTGEIYTASYKGDGVKALVGYRVGDDTTSTRIKGREFDHATFELLSALPEDQNRILVVEYPWTKEGNYWYDTRQRLPILSQMDVRSGKKYQSETLPFRDPQLLVDASGVVKFAIWDNEAGERRMSYRESAKHEWQEMPIDELRISKESNRSHINSRINNKGDTVYLSGEFGEHGYRTIYEMDLASRSFRPMFTDLDADIVDWQYDPETGDVVAGVSYRDKARYHFADSDSVFLKSYRGLTRAFKGQNVSVVSRTKDNSHILVQVSSDVNPGEYYYYNRQTNKADFVWANWSWIDPQDLQPMITDTTVSADGMEIPIRLTLPAQPTGAPTVVLLHGGPHGVMDTWIFDPEVQLLANRGYAVLQVNFRGSGGFGAAFERAGYREWGGKMIDDIFHATRSVMTKYQLDSKKVCAFGASFGGYASLMLAAKYPESIRCAVGYVGIYDLNLMYESGDIPLRWGGVNYLETVLGTDADLLSEFSPIAHAKKIKANVMLIHGEKDQRAPVEHAEAMKKALERSGSKPSWHIYDRSGHGVVGIDDRRELYTKVLAFFNANLQ